MIRRHLLVIATALSALTVSVAHGQAAATMCKDGSTTASSGKGACSGHGGVDAKAMKAATKEAKSAKAAEKRAEKATTVTCSDGTTSNGGRGACSGHGGIGGSKSTTAAPPTTPSLPATVPPTAPSRRPSGAKSTAATATHASSKRGEDNDATDAIAQCKDGMYSHAANHRGACSRHGGVAKFLKP
jgi:hypothetical protein